MRTDVSRYEIQRWEQMSGDTKYLDGNWWQTTQYTEMGNDGWRYDIRGLEMWSQLDIQRRVLLARDTIYRYSTWWQGIRYTEMGNGWQAILCTDIGTDGCRKNIHRWELLAVDRILEIGTYVRRYAMLSWYLRQAIRYTELGYYGWEYNIQKWEMMAGNTIHREGNWWHALRYTKLGKRAGDTM